MIAGRARRALRSSVVLALVLAATEASAAPLPDKLPPPSTAELGALRMHAEGVPACMSAQLLLDALAREFPAAGAVAAELDVVGSTDAIMFELVGASGSATRRFEFEASACEQRVRVVGLSMALALEALVTETPRVAPAPTLRRTVTPTTTPVAAPSPVPASTPRARWGLGIGVLGAFGDAPAPQLGGSLQPRVGGSRWAARARASMAASPATELGGGELRVLSFAVLVDGCARWPAGTAAMLACAGVEVGLTHARGRGYAYPRRDVVPAFGPAAAFELVAPITGRLALTLTAGVVIPVLRARFVGDTASTRAWPAAVRAGLALVVALGRAKP